MNDGGKQMKEQTIDNVIRALLVLLVIIICLCLLELKQEVNGIQDDLEQFKAETYDRERSLLSVKVVTLPPLVVNEPEPEPVNNATEVQNDDIALVNDEVAEYAHVWDEDYILRVLTAEAGSDEVLCGCVAQALYNACARDDWVHTPNEVLVMYGYTGPASWISDAAVAAYDQVFCSGVTYTDVEDALYFYAPQYCDSPWHESQRFVCEVSGVRFFARWD